ncbi:hypothetical protein BJV78DRAFT_1167737 [Lactifluus subvellereus]|nr:hypothetical protein BJV78DRAFT_1167737 [Lactifluus subvellereus]
MSSSQVDLPLHHHSLNLTTLSLPHILFSPNFTRNPYPGPLFLRRVYLGFTPRVSLFYFIFNINSYFLSAPKSQPSHSEDDRRPVVEDGRQLAKVQKRASLVKKRQSNVLKLSEENDKLKEELRAMTERLEAAERRRQELESSRGGRQPHVG